MKDIDNLKLNYSLSPPSIESKVGYNLNNKDLFFADSHFIYAEVLIAGEKLLENVSYKLKVEQKTLDHSRFTLECPGEAFESLEDYPLKNSKYVIGEKISVFFKQKKSIVFTFTGIVTHLDHIRDKNRYTTIQLQGYSPTILMERGKIARSFDNLTLEEIVKKIIEQGNYPTDLLEFTLSPKLKEKLYYTVQYNQSDYKFLQSLAQRYGEWLYHNGTNIVFGGFGGKTIELTEEEELEEYRIKLHTAPQKFGYTAYQSEYAQIIKTDSNSTKKQDSIINPFQRQAIENSEQIYSQIAESLYNFSLLNNGERELNDEIERESQARQNLAFLEGKSNKAEIKVGDIIKVRGYIPQSNLFKNGIVPLESYLVTEIHHHYEEAEGYYNTFTAIPKEQLIPPYYNARAYPKAEEQRAIVTDNDDPKGVGRVRVQFDWQKEAEQTPWIRLVQPHVGGNKGFYFIPEIGEEVMVNFESENSEKPYVIGTYYNGVEKSAYHTSSNDLKAIHTRSGTKIILNDAEGSVFIEDPSGNTYLMDGKGNIKLNAPETFSVDAKNVVVSASQNISMNAGENISEFAGEDYNLAANNIFENAGEYRASTAKEVVETSQKGTYTSEEDILNLESGAEVKSNSAEQTTLH